MLEGLEVPLARMRIARCASWRCRAHCTWQRWSGRAATKTPWPVAVRRALVRLGPAFVKLGQIASVRADLFPTALVDALHSLQSDVPSGAHPPIRSIVERELGAPIEAVFHKFVDEPIAAGSVAQVHDAELLDGTRVAVKVKRVGIDEVFERDLEILLWLASIAETHWPAARDYRPVAAAHELLRYTRRELDFTNEARAMKEIGAAFATHPDVLIPRVHRSTTSILIMDFIDCVPLDDASALDAMGLDRKRLVRIGLEAMLTQIFDLGVFHGDPHPGNLRATRDGKIVMLDFGIYGRLNERLQRACAVLIWTMARGDAELTSYFLVRVAEPDGAANVRGFRRAMQERYRDWFGASVSEYGFGRLAFEELTLAGRYGLAMPPDLVLLAKALVTIEGVVRALDPEVDLAKEAGPYLERVRGRLFSVAHVKDGLTRSLPLWWDVLERAPVAVAELLDRNIAAATENKQAPAARHHLDAIGGSIIASSFVLAGAIALAAATQPAAVVLGAVSLAIGLVAAGFRTLRGLKRDAPADRHER